MMATPSSDDRAIEEKAEALLEILHNNRKSRPNPTGLDHYDPRPTDVIITTFSKAGTTLLQNLTYHLVYLTLLAPDSATPPLETFSDISYATPWLDFFPEMGVPLPAADPRVFKTHSPFSKFARFHDDPATAPRQVLVVRSPFALPASYLDFLFDDLTGGQPGAADPAVRAAVFRAFVRHWLAGPDNAAVMGSWFAHARDYTRPMRQNVLVLFFEDVVVDLAGTTRTVARFLGIDEARVTDEVVDKVAKACDRKVMAGDSRFQCHVEAKAFNHGPVWKAMVENRENSFKQFKFTEEEIAAVNQKMQDVLGYPNYEAFKEATKKEQMERFRR